MRRPPKLPHESPDRWLVSYADFITLLFALFVVMFAVSQSDKSKAKAVSDAVKEALAHGQFSETLAAVLGKGKYENGKPPGPERVKDSGTLPLQTPPSPHAPPADLAKSLMVLQDRLDAELKTGKIGLKLEGRGLVISLREATFFASGDDAVSPGSEAILAKIAAEIQRFSNPVRLEGHTDSQPIHNSRFRSNWELSAARSIAMLELLRQKFGIAAERMSVAGYAENAPVEANDTEAGRALNRRVDLVILSDEGVKSEPGGR